MKTYAPPGALLAAAMIAMSAMAATAQGLPGGAASTYDMSQLPQFSGRVAQYGLTPRGDVDGLILDDGTEVRFPPHLGAEVVALVRPGDTVTIHGLRAKALPLIQAMSITGDASGRTVVDNGPPENDPGAGREGRRPGPNPASAQPMQAQGRVKMRLHGPRGDLNGVLLQDGTIVRLPPAEAGRLIGALSAGQTVAVRGPGLESALGRVIDAREFGPAPDQMTPVRPPNPRGAEGRPQPGPPSQPPAAIQPPAAPR